MLATDGSNSAADGVRVVFDVRVAARMMVVAVATMVLGVRIPRRLASGDGSPRARSSALGWRRRASPPAQPPCPRGGGRVVHPVVLQTHGPPVAGVMGSARRYTSAGLNVFCDVCGPVPQQVWRACDDCLQVIGQRALSAGGAALAQARSEV